MNVFSVHAQFQLPDDFIGDTPAALVALAAHLRSNPPTTKPNVPEVALARDKLEREFRKAMARGERYVGLMSIGVLGPEQVADDEELLAMQPPLASAEVTP